MNFDLRAWAARHGFNGEQAGEALGVDRATFYRYCTQPELPKWLVLACERLDDEWMPIETASKEKTLLLGFFNENGKWRTTRGCWFTKEEIEDTWEDDDMPEGWYETPVESEHCYYIEPTHWMQLPKPPTD